MKLSGQSEQSKPTSLRLYNQRVKAKCRKAKLLEDKGEHEQAREALHSLWQRVGDSPLLENLEKEIEAEVLLRTGTLTGWLGTTYQIADAQVIARRLIERSRVIYTRLSNLLKVAEAENCMGVCYWREGRFQEARATFQGAMAALKERDGELRATILVNAAMVERSECAYVEAQRLQLEAAQLVEASENPALKARYFKGLAMTWRKMGQIDRALVDYAAASHFFEQAGHHRFRADVENNLGYLFFSIEDHEQAGEHLAKAERLYSRLKDRRGLALVNDTWARIHLAQHNLRRAETSILAALRTWEHGDEYEQLFDSLVTWGCVLARTARAKESVSTFMRAYNLALGKADAGRIAQVSTQLMAEIKAGHIQELLERRQEVNVEVRFNKAVLAFEAQLIKDALDSSSHNITQAALKLGLQQQYLSWLLGTRHKELHPDFKRSRTQPPQFRSLIRTAKTTGKNFNRNVTNLHDKKRSSG